MSIKVFDASAGSHTASLTAAKTGGGTGVTIRYVKVAVIPLTGTRLAGFVPGASDDEATTTATTFQNKLACTWTPSAAGNWLLLSTFPHGRLLRELLHRGAGPT